MWTIIIVSVLFSFLFLKDDYSYIDWRDLILIIPFTLFIGAFIGGLIAVALPAKTEQVVTTYELESLQDGSLMSGSFFLGSGVVKDEMKYIFYYEEDGFYKLKQVDYNDAKISYSDGKPRAERYKFEEVVGPFINYFALDYLGEEEYIIYIPKGTIKQDYNLDAK